MIKWIKCSDELPPDIESASIRFISDKFPIPNMRILVRDSLGTPIYDGALQMDGEYYFRNSIPLNEIEWAKETEEPSFSLEDMKLAFNEGKDAALTNLNSAGFYNLEYKEFELDKKQWFKQEYNIDL